MCIRDRHKGVRAGIKDGSLAPVFCGSCATTEGVDLMMDLLVELMPPASELSGETAVDPDDKEIEVSCDPAAPLAAFVFKTVADPFVGKLSYIKVFAGTLSADQQPVNQRTGQPEKLGTVSYTHLDVYKRQ